MDCSQSALVAAAKCFRCHGHDERERVKIYLLCQLATVGVMANIVPPGSTYSGATPTFTLTVAPNTSYVIMWGANDLSMTMGGVTYNSTGLNTSTVVYTGSNTQMVFTGTFAGTTVTVRVSAAPPAKVPIPSGFTAVLNAAGTSIVVGWDTPVLTFVNYTEVWTSNDNVTYSLAATVNFPTASTTVPAPSAGSTKYVKIRWCSNALAACGSFTSAIQLSGTVANWASRVITNGGAAVSSSTLAAMNTFWNSIVSAGIDSLMISVMPIVPDNLIAAITPLYKTLGNDPWTNHSFVAGDLTVNGLLGDGASKWLDTGVVASAAWPPGGGKDNGFTVYNMSSINSGTSLEIGALAGGTNCMLEVDFNDGHTYFSTYGVTDGTSRVNAANNLFTGLISANRTSASRADVYTASSTKTFSSIGNATGNLGTTGTGLGGNMYAFAVNNSGAAASFTSRRMSFLAIHVGLSSAQAQIFYNAIQALRTALGGGFV